MTIDDRGNKEPNTMPRVALALMTNCCYCINIVKRHLQTKTRKREANEAPRVRSSRRRCSQGCVGAFQPPESEYFLVFSALNALYYALLQTPGFATLEQNDS